jgi:hypothetical protein
MPLLREDFHILLKESALSWLVVGLAVWLLPLAMAYHDWLAGLGSIIGILLGTPVAKLWVPDPRILGVPYLRRYKDVTNDSIHQPLIIYLRSEKKVVYPVVTGFLVIAVAITIFQYPNTFHEPISFIASMIGSIIGTVWCCLALFYYRAAREEGV